MTQTGKSPFARSQGPSQALSLSIAAGMVAAMAYVRLVVAPGRVLPIAYGVPLLICIWFRNRQILWGLVAAFTIITFIKYAFLWTGDPNYAGGARWWVWGMIQGDLLVIAAVVHYVIGAREAMERHAREMEASNRDLKEERRRLGAIFRTLPVAVVITDAGGTDVRMNPAAAEMYGVAAEVNIAGALASPPFHLERDGRRIDLSESVLARALRRAEEIRGEESDVVFSDGRRVTQLGSASPIFDGDQRVIGAVAALVDVTTLKTLQRELEQRRRDAEDAAVRKTRFLAAVSHDIRTPANAINLLAELLRRSAEDPTPGGSIDVPEMARELQASALSLVHLVSDVLDVTRYDYGKMEVNLSEFPLLQLMEEQARQHRPVADSKGLALVVEPPPGLVLRTDAIKLGRVLSNLVGNAVKFTETGSVTLAAALLADGRVRLSVTDTGPGIDAEHQARIFDEFFQIKNPSRDRTKGTGLGLAICKRLVEAVGGQLEVHSEVGRGSTFTVNLPPWVTVSRPGPVSAVPAIGPAVARTAGASPRVGSSLVDLHVLLVEDHTATRRATARILAADGAQVTEAVDGRAAMQQLDQAGYDALLLDMMLPDMDGREVLRRLQTHRPPRLRTVLVMTGDMTPERAREVIDLGADGLMHKPINVSDVIAFLGGRRNADSAL